MSRKSLFCIASSRGHAERLVYRLKNSGFCNRDVSALYPDVSTAEEREAMVAETAAAKAAGRQDSNEFDSLNWLFRLGPMTIPDVGPYMGAGPIILALKRGTGKSTIAQGLVGMGVSEKAARKFEDKIKDGSFLISFHNEHPEEIARAEIILQVCGGQDIYASAE